MYHLNSAHREAGSSTLSLRVTTERNCNPAAVYLSCILYSKPVNEATVLSLQTTGHKEPPVIGVEGNAALAV